MALTDTEVRKSKPRSKPYRVADGGGLHLYVTPSGGKLWRWKFRFRGKERLMAFGSYPEVTLAMAREKHAEQRRLLKTGVDPMAARKAAKGAERIAGENSFEKVAARWLEHWREGKRPRHVGYVDRRIKAYVIPAIGHRPIAEIEAPELVAMVQAIQARGALAVARMTLHTVNQIFRHAISHGYAKRNPASDFRPGDVLRASPTVNRARVDARELPALLREIEAYPGRHATRLALKLMALCFVRTGELLGARWEEVDIEARRWEIPKERMKMKIPLIVPLASQTIEVLEQLRTLTGGGELLFPGGVDPHKPLSSNTILRALEQLGFKGRMTGHGFRGIASTVLHEMGFNHDWIEIQLSHLPGSKVSSAYNFAAYLEPRAAMMQAWANFISGTQQSGKVLPFINKGVA